jgi:hypothetical protein
MLSYPERLRAKAEEIRETARASADADIQRHFFVVADQYERLAKNVERAGECNKR